MGDVLLLFSVLLLAVTAGAAPPSSTSTTTSCSDELVSFSPCLPYISSSPNNISDLPPVQCCDNFAAAFDNNTVICICYLVRNPLILGFPIDSSKLMTLTSVCPVKEKQGRESFSLQSLCSGSTMLPPFRSTTDHRGSSSGPTRPSPSPSPSPSPRPQLPHSDDDDIPSQVPPGPVSSLPPSSDAADKPSSTAQATPSSSSTAEIDRNNSQWNGDAIFIFLGMLIYLYALASC